MSKAKQLKELGFDWECDYHYDFVIDSSLILQTPTRNSDLMEHCVAVPSLSLAQKWLRDVKDVVVVATPDWDWNDDDSFLDFLTGDWNFELWHEEYRNRENILYDSYESALSAGIDAALELLTHKAITKGNIPTLWEKVVASR